MSVLIETEHKLMAIWIDSLLRKEVIRFLKPAQLMFD